VHLCVCVCIFFTQGTLTNNRGSYLFKGGGEVLNEDHCFAREAGIFPTTLICKYFYSAKIITEGIFCAPVP